MQVLRKGSQDKIERSCTGAGYGGGGCGALLMVETPDVQFEKDAAVFFVCPECGVKNGLSYKDIPKKMWSMFEY